MSLGSEEEINGFRSGFFETARHRAVFGPNYFFYKIHTFWAVFKNGVPSISSLL